MCTYVYKMAGSSTRKKLFHVIHWILIKQIKKLYSMIGNLDLGKTASESWKGNFFFFQINYRLLDKLFLIQRLY